MLPRACRRARLTRNFLKVPKQWQLTFCTDSPTTTTPYEAAQQKEKLYDERTDFSHLEKAPTSSKEKLYAIRSIRGFLDLNVNLCPGCGTQFQSSYEHAPGYLSKEKMAQHRKNATIIREQQHALKILDEASLDIETSRGMEVLLTAGVPKEIIESLREISRKFRPNPDVAVPDPKADEMLRSTPSKPRFGSLLPYPKNKAEAKSLINSLQAKDTTLEDVKICICQRCFRLQQYNDVEPNLRPGWSEHKELEPKRFADMLKNIHKSKCIVLCLVDIFDIQGSLLRNLKEIAGDNPIFLAVNKTDLLPADTNLQRIKEWIYAEARLAASLYTPKDATERHKHTMSFKEYWQREPMTEKGILRLSNIHLISTLKGHGLRSLIEHLTTDAKAHGGRVYVMGAANVGKSSFINRLLGTSDPNHKDKSSHLPRTTVSSLPGTTLNFIKIKLPKDVTVIDTPGLINPEQLTSKLTFDELKYVLPQKRLAPITFRMFEGRCVCLGGLAVVDFIEGKPFFMTFFLSSQVKIHVTSSSKVPDIYEKHIGSLMFPPMTYERMQELLPYEEKELTLTGDSWKQAAADIVIAGLGWVAVTGSGTCRIRVRVPKGTLVDTRPPLMPYEARYSTATYRDGHVEKKSEKVDAVFKKKMA